MIIFIVVIESIFIFRMISVLQFYAVHVEAMKQLLALSPSQVRALCISILALTPRCAI